MTWENLWRASTRHPAPPGVARHVLAGSQRRYGTCWLARVHDIDVSDAHDGTGAIFTAMT
jgi:hypothetical protein